MSRDERAAWVRKLHASGMSNRAIADAVEVSEMTVRRDLKSEVRHSVAPEPTTKGSDATPVSCDEKTVRNELKRVSGADGSAPEPTTKGSDASCAMDSAASISRHVVGSVNVVCVIKELQKIHRCLSFEFDRPRCH
jgi:hypothetical protein